MNRNSLILTVLAAMFFAACTKKADHAVDLGLPSGTLWADCNVGAENPWQYGDYFAWGETATKDAYEWTNYRFSVGGRNLTKYCTDSAEGLNGYSDTLITLEIADDAAAVSWGGSWRVPTNELWQELARECYWVWTTIYADTSVAGFIVYRAKNINHKGVVTRTPSAEYAIADAHIFLPATGYHYGENYYDDGRYGYYWANQLCTDYPQTARNIGFDTTGIRYDWNCGSRYDGLSVRPVKR